LGIAFTGRQQAKLNAAKQPVDRSAFAIPGNVMTTAIAPVERHFTVPGTLEPDDHAKVMLNAQGKLASASPWTSAQRVTKGQVLGSLDVAQKQLELEAAELSWRSSEGLRSLPELVEGKAASRGTTMISTSSTRMPKVKVDQIRQQIRDAQVIAP
jgi:multidrug efflux pump subunit AcrA (membrane-fusion protein)